MKRSGRDCLGWAGERCWSRVYPPANRCQRHEAARQRARGSPAARGYDRSWYALSRRERAAEGRCAGCGSTEDLTLDHVVNGDRSRTQVLCRSCNSTKRSLERAAARRLLPG